MAIFRKRKIHIFVLIICFIISLTLSACSSGETGYTDPDATGKPSVEQPVCNHSYSKWIVDKEATIYEEGSQHRECTKCKEILDTKSIDKLSLTTAEIKQKLQDSVFKIYNYDYDKTTVLSQGTGFFIDNRGNFITNAHVLEGTYFSEIVLSLSRKYEVDKIYKVDDLLSDYAICHAAISISTPVSFCETAELGETVYSLGFPNDSMLLTINSGEMTSLDNIDGYKHYYGNTAIIDHGSSGGALVNAIGEVIGITTGEFADNEYAAIRYKDIKPFVNGVHIGGKEPLEQYHTVTEIRLGTYNASTYFDILVTDTPNSYLMSIHYTVAVKLKSIYSKKKIIVDSFHLYFSVKLDTTYSYDLYQSYGTVHKNDTHTDYCTIYMYKEANVKNGESTIANDNISIYGDHGSVTYTYSTSFYGAVGTFRMID